LNSGTVRQPVFLIPLGVQQKKLNASVIEVNLQKKSDQKHTDAKVFNLDSFLLGDAKYHAEKTKKTTNLKLLGVAVVVLGHLLVCFMLLTKHNQVPVLKPAKPITISIVAAPASEIKPEIVPIVEPVKVAKKRIDKPRKVIEKILGVENQNQSSFEATTEPVDEKFEPAAELSAPAIVAEKAATKTIPEVEKIELPKFGVAYLNNPAPDYPGVSKRAGEEGRVLLKVLVSANGDAENVDIEKSSQFDRLDQAAINAVKRWRFIPARKGNQMLSAYVLVPVKFSLSN